MSIRTRVVASLFLGLTVIPVLGSLGCGGGGGGGGSSNRQLFEITIENISGPTTLTAPAIGPIPIIFSPAVFAVHSGVAPAYTLGQPARANGLEPFAEDIDPTDLITALQLTDGVSLLGLAQTPVGEESANVLVPGSTYRTVIRAAAGDRLTLMLAFVQGNDLFVGTGDQGLFLFDAAGAPISGDITGNFVLLDAGTEVNERPGVGPSQSPRQPAINTGAAESAPVAPVNDGFTYPTVPAMLRISIAPK